MRYALTLFVTLGFTIQLMAQRPPERPVIPPSNAGEPIRIGIDSTLEQRSKKFALVRDWIWTHWQNHINGKLAVVIVSYEGHESRSTINIKSNSLETWYVVFQTDRYVSGKFEERDSFEASFVEKVPIGKAGPFEDLTPGASRKPSKSTDFQLVFRGKDGKVISQF